MRQVSEILRAIDAGEEVSTESLLPAVYSELRSMAVALLSRESPGQTLQATALVHEAYLRLHRELAPNSATDDRTTSTLGLLGWNSRAHFFAAAAEAMRRILVDTARRKKRLKRGGAQVRVDIDPNEILIDTPPDDLLDLHDALTRFEASEPEKAKVVKLRYFAGLTIEETAAAMAISEPTVKRYWAYGRAWLRRETLGRSHDTLDEEV